MISPLNDAVVNLDGKDFIIESSGQAPVFNKIVSGTNADNDKNEVVLPEALVKKMGRTNDEMIGKQVSFVGTVFNFESGEPVEMPVSFQVTVSGVADTSYGIEFEGQVMKVENEDSLFLSLAVMKDIYAQAEKENPSFSFTIRPTSPENYLEIYDELMAKGIVPLGLVELMRDIVGLKGDAMAQTGISYALIAVLSVLAALSVCLVCSIMRKKEYAVYQLSGYTKSDIATLTLVEYTVMFLVGGILCAVTAVLLGASGSGKSTLFNLLAGFDRDYSGEIVVAGQNIAELSEMELSDYRKHSIGFIFQEYHLLAGYTVLENILLAAEITCQDEEQSKAWALELLERLGIKEKSHEKTENLLGGQKQRAAIARALAGNPNLILADEPTGALDRNTANEIMTLLAEIAQERPVLIITHDKKICDFADEVITIEDRKCKVVKEAVNGGQKPATSPQSMAGVRTSMPKRAFHNFRVHCRRFLGISLAVTVAVCAVLMSFSSQNIIYDKIRSFEEKNTAFAWGQVVLGEDKAVESFLSILEQSSQVQSYYAQYPVAESNISFEDQSVTLPQKSFGSIAAESMNIGVMPQGGKISITPSLAKQFAEDIRTLIGKEITFVCGDFSKNLTVSGIFNGSFDDYYLDATTEQDLHKALQTKEKPVSVAYKVNEFQEVLEVEAQLVKEGFPPITASKQVESLKTAFEKLQTLFVVVSVFIVAISLFICIMLLMKTVRMMPLHKSEKVREAVQCTTHFRVQPGKAKPQ